MKKTIITISIIITALLSVFSTITPVFAVPVQGTDSSASTTPADPNADATATGGSSTGGSYVDGTCNTFLGLTSWNCGIEITDESSLKTNIWKIAVNISIDITIIAAYLVLGYVIYGGYLYIFSAGEPGKVASGRKTLLHAFIGLAIVMSANIIMSAIRYALLKDGKLNCDPLTGNGCIEDPGTLISNSLQWIIAIGGVVATIFVVYGGIAYITSAGDPGKVQKAKQIIIYALIGLAVVGLAQLITAFVTTIIRDANNGTQSTLDKTNIIYIKEQNEKTII